MDWKIQYKCRNAFFSPAAGYHYLSEVFPATPPPCYMYATPQIQKSVRVPPLPIERVRVPPLPAAGRQENFEILVHKNRETLSKQAFLKGIFIIWSCKCWNFRLRRILVLYSQSKCWSKLSWNARKHMNPEFTNGTGRVFYSQTGPKRIERAKTHESEFSQWYMPPILFAKHFKSGWCALKQTNDGCEKKNLNKKIRNFQHFLKRSKMRLLGEKKFRRRRRRKFSSDKPPPCIRNTRKQGGGLWLGIPLITPVGQLSEKNGK